MEGSMPVGVTIWREGAWIDLWSIVHFLSGLSMGFGLYILEGGGFASSAVTLLSLVLYERWEAQMHIEETTGNRVADVLIGMAGFFSAYFFFSVLISPQFLIPAFWLAFAINIAMGLWGSIAFYKAAEFKKRGRKTMPFAVHNR
jgi:hypothetical protein